MQAEERKCGCCYCCCSIIQLFYLFLRNRLIVKRITQKGNNTRTRALLPQLTNTRHPGAKCNKPHAYKTLERNGKQIIKRTTVADLPQLAEERKKGIQQCLCCALAVCMCESYSWFVTAKRPSTHIRRISVLVTKKGLLPLVWTIIFPFPAM